MCTPTPVIWGISESGCQGAAVMCRVSSIYRCEKLLNKGFGIIFSPRWFHSDTSDFYLFFLSFLFLVFCWRRWLSWDVWESFAADHLSAFMEDCLFICCCCEALYYLTRLMLTSEKKVHECTTTTEVTHVTKTTRADVCHLTVTGYHVHLFHLRLLSQGQCTSDYWQLRSSINLNSAHLLF